MESIIKNIFLIALLFFVVANINSSTLASNANSNQNNSLSLSVTINNITFEDVTAHSFNLSLQYNIYNENGVDVQYQSSNACGFTLSANITSSEIDIGQGYVFNYCPTIQTTKIYKPGITQETQIATIGFQNWPPGTNSLNDLPLAQYKLNIDHPNLLNMSTYGAIIMYNGTGHFFIQYDQSPFSSGGPGTTVYETIVPNTFIRTTIIQNNTNSTSNLVTTNSSSAIFLFFAFFIAIVVIIFPFAYRSRKRSNIQREENNKVNKLSSNGIQSGTYLKVVLERSCPVCGNTLTETDVFCANCGNRTT